MAIKYELNILPVLLLDTYLSPKAMALVTERMNANKPATPDPKGKINAAQMNNNKDLEVDLKKEEPSFFGSFFSSARGQQQKTKKGPQPMEAVLVFFNFSRYRELSVST
jgi:hypothetical protein